MFGTTQQSPQMNSFTNSGNVIFPDTQAIAINEPFQGIETSFFQPDTFQNPSSVPLLNSSTGTKRSRSEFELSRDNFHSKSTIFDTLIPNPSENLSFDVHGAIAYPFTPFVPLRKSHGFVVFAQNVGPIKDVENRLNSMGLYHRLVVNQVSFSLLNSLSLS